MILDYENGIRGGITRYICQYVKANNKYMHRQDETKESSYISYLDFKNHYGWPLRLLLYYGGFEYVQNTSVFAHEFIMNYDLIADVDYPEYLQRLHKDLPFLPEKLVITKESILAFILYDKKYTSHLRLLKKL